MIWRWIAPLNESPPRTFNLSAALPGLRVLREQTHCTTNQTPTIPTTKPPSYLTHTHKTHYSLFTHTLNAQDKHHLSGTGPKVPPSANTTTKRGQMGHALSMYSTPWEKLSSQKNTPRHNSPIMTLGLRHTDEENMQPFVKIALTSNSPAPNATSSKTIMTAPMPSAALAMKNAIAYVKSISLHHQRISH